MTKKIEVLTFMIIISFVSILVDSANGEPYIPTEDERQAYQDKLDLRDTLTAKQQLASGIKFMDVTCNVNKIPILKLSANSIACVTKDSANILQERMWGVVHKENNSGVGIWECSDRYIFEYSNPKPIESEVIKKFRMTIMEFSLDEVYWKSITLDESSNMSLHLSTTGNFTEKQQDIIIEELTKIKSISSVTREQSGCI